MGEFTKGPWEAVKRTSYDGDDYWLIQTESERNGWELAEVRMDVPDAEGNARVMAASSALLEALEEMCAEFRALDLPYGSAAYCKANSLINKVRARGEA